jgi:hypothetical protein
MAYAILCPKVVYVIVFTLRDDANRIILSTFWYSIPCPRITSYNRAILFQLEATASTLRTRGEVDTPLPSLV